MLTEVYVSNRDNTGSKKPNKSQINNFINYAKEFELCTRGF